MENDESIVEETTTSPSEENQTEVEQTEQSVETTPKVEKKDIPYDRFQEVVNEKNKYKDLLSVLQSEPKTQKSSDEIAKEIESQTGQSYDDTIKVIETKTKEILQKELSQRDRKADLDKAIATYPDFYKFADAIKAKVQENPNISWSDAYKSVHYDVALSQAESVGQQKAYKKIAEKKSAIVETASKAKPATSDIGTIDPLAKGPDGKFLYSTKELEDILKN